MDKRLVAVTHGDPSKAERCGRPLYIREAKEGDKAGIDKIYVCPFHGDVTDATPHAYFAFDARPRRKYDE